LCVILLCARQHGCGTIQSGDLRLWPASVQLLGAVAGAAAKVDEPHGFIESDLRDQIRSRPSTLIGELQIEFGIPVGHFVLDLTTKDTKENEDKIKLFLVTKRKRGNICRAFVVLCVLCA